MLKKANRLTKDNDFSKVFKMGKNAYLDILGVKALKNDLDQSRFGIIVSTKISKKAVERNRVKRLIRESIKVKIGAFLHNYDIVIIALPPILHKEIADIESALGACLKKVGVIE